MKHAGNALKYLSLLFMFVAFPYQNAVAQNGNVKGTVVADDGPIIGATVRVKANVPEAQQSGITIWSLSDNEVEHEYWLKGQVPNLFDKDYKRKWAYKGFCDGIAGEDLGLKYGGEEYKAFYEKNNVSSTVDK